ncbi:MAG: hypothetical protein V4555_01645 [Acidobacteriota bacterium]
MQATAMTGDGRLTFLHQPWWERAQALREGDSFTLDLNHDGRPDTIIKRSDGNIVEAIDDSGKAANIWNETDTAYVVSYKGTGIVDRMVVYTDNNNDGRSDEMEIRYYKDGYLRYAWFGENYDDDGAQIFHLTNWQYDGQQFVSKFRGNVMIYVNKYDPRTKSWTPLSECPFAFYDPNHDGLGEIVLRAAVETRATARESRAAALNKANSYSPMWQDEPIGLNDVELQNVRLSYNVDPEPRKDALSHPHYNFGFTMVANEPYRFAGMRYTNLRRRAPQTVVRMDWKNAVDHALAYPADQTGFSWDEAHDVYRWEGQFWIYERRILANTGGPVQRWNMRREFLGKKAVRRELYYSEVDKRYHLRGASEMWLEVGHVVNEDKDMEVRAYDTDGDGYLDTWEVFRTGEANPVRVTHVSAEQARPVALDRKAMMMEYNQHILPEAIAEDQRFLAIAKGVVSSALAVKYERAAEQTDILERRRYCLDVARELYFEQVLDGLYKSNPAGEYKLHAGEGKLDDGRATRTHNSYSIDDTTAYWTTATGIEKFVEAYGNGHYDEAVRELASLTSNSRP